MADITVTAANVLLVSGDKQSGTSGEAITAGETLYLKAADSRLWLADANDSAATASCVGIALTDAPGAGQPLFYAGDNSVIDIGGTVTVGESYFVSPDPGGIQPHADLLNPDWVFGLGIGITSTNIKLKFNNSGVQVPA